MLDRNENQTRGGPVAQLIDQQLLRGRGMGRQERRQIGAVMGARDHEDGKRDAAEPNDQHTRAAHIHGRVDGRKVINDRSPSG